MEPEVYLTVDVEWAHDNVLAPCLDLLEKTGVPVTFFVTHETPLLARMRENPLFELGIHPNFNPLLEAGGSREGADEILKRLMDIVPEAKSVRSHSLVQGSRILDLFSRSGLTHEANVFIPYEAGLALKPWRHWNGLIRVPHFWEDDIHWHDLPPGAGPKLLDKPGLKVFDFHPLSLFLNIESSERYNRARPFLQDPGQLSALIHQGHGVRSFFEEVAVEMGRRKIRGGRVADIRKI